MFARLRRLRSGAKRQRSPSHEPTRIKKQKIQDSLQLANLESLTSGEYGDFSLVCGDREWRLHRVVVCPRTKFFDVALKSSFLEGSSKRIVLPDDDPRIVEKLLVYLYTSDYDDEPSSQEPEDASSHDSSPEPAEYNQIIAHVRVYSLADRFDIKDLKTMAKRKFEAAITKRWPLPSFPAIVREIFRSTPSLDNGLRDIVISLCAQHMEDLIEERDVDNASQPSTDISPQVQEGTTWRDVMDEFRTFTNPLLARVIKAKSLEEATKTMDMLKAKFGQAGWELSSMINLASRSPQCCGTAKFNIHASRGTPFTPARLGLRCTICRHLYSEL